MLVIIFLVFLLYTVLLYALHAGWLKVESQATPPDAVEYKFISIIVPVRNEEENIPFLLSDIIAQQYPENCFELLIINDHSEDNTLQVVEETLKASAFSNVTIVHSLKKGKKHAISEGVNLAKGSIILTTDADCRVGTDWLKSFNAYFVGESVKLVFGAVRTNPGKSLFEKMQAIEFASLIGSGAATLGFGVPTMCNGANLAFRKETFTEVGGFDDNFHIASGDDEFLMRKIHRKYSDGIHFNIRKESIVSTQAQETLSIFISQRLRWAGKWKYHNDFKTKLLASFIFIFHFINITLPVLVLMGYVSWGIILALFIIKALFEYRFISCVVSWLNAGWSWPGFIILQVIYSLYAVLVGLLATFSDTEWKGRKI